MADLSVQSVGPRGTEYTLATGSAGGDAIPMVSVRVGALVVRNNGATAATETITLVSQESDPQIGSAASNETLDVASGSQAAFYLNRSVVADLLDSNTKIQVTYTNNTAFDLAFLKFD